MLYFLIMEHAPAIIDCVMLVIHDVFLFDALIRHHSTGNRCGNAVMDKTAQKIAQLSSRLVAQSLFFTPGLSTLKQLNFGIRRVELPVCKCIGLCGVCQNEAFTEATLSSDDSSSDGES